MEELGFWTECVWPELRHELFTTGAAAIEDGDTIIFMGVTWKAGILTAVSSDAVTGMTPIRENMGGKGKKRNLKKLKPLIVLKSNPEC